MGTSTCSNGIPVGKPARFSSPDQREPVPPRQKLPPRRPHRAAPGRLCHRLGVPKSRRTSGRLGSPSHPLRRGPGPGPAEHPGPAGASAVLPAVRAEARRHRRASPDADCRQAPPIHAGDLSAGLWRGFSEAAGIRPRPSDAAGRVARLRRVDFVPAGLPGRSARPGAREHRSSRIGRADRRRHRATALFNVSDFERARGPRLRESWLSAK